MINNMALSRDGRLAWSLYDYVMALYFVCVLAFTDVKPLFLGMQFLMIIITVFRMMRHRSYTYDACIKLLRWSLLFTLFCLLSTLWASDSNKTLVSSSISVIQVALMAFCMLRYAAGKAKTMNLVYFFIVASVVICLRFIITIPVSAWGGQERFSRETIFGSNSTSMTLAYAALLAIWLLYSKQVERKGARNLCIVLVAIFTLVSFLAGTRKSVLIVFIGVVTMLLSNMTNTAVIIKRCVLVALFLFVVYMAITRISVLYDSIGYRIESMLDFYSSGQTDKSFITRRFLISDGFGAFLKNPIVGLGQDGYRYANITGFYAHNNYIELLANLGIVGFALYYSLILRYTKIAFHYRKQISLPIIIFASILFTDFSAVSYESELNYTLLAIALAMLSSQSDKGRKDQYA